MAGFLGVITRLRGVYDTYRGNGVPECRRLFPSPGGRGIQGEGAIFIFINLPGTWNTETPTEGWPGRGQEWTGAALKRGPLFLSCEIRYCGIYCSIRPYVNSPFLTGMMAESMIPEESLADIEALLSG